MEKLMKYFLVAVLVFFGIHACFVLPVSASSLFDVSDEKSPFYPEIKEEESSLPDYATDEYGEILMNQNTALKDALYPDSDSDTGLCFSSDDNAGTVSGNDQPLSPTLEDMENIMESALSETRATNLSIADAYLSSAVVDVFSRVVDGLPVHYKYAAYRLNASDGNEGYMIYGPKAKKNAASLDFEPGSQLVHYYRIQRSSSYSTWYEYKYDVTTVTDTYRVPYHSGQLIYTNMVPGYPVVSRLTEAGMVSILVPVLILSACFILIMRRKN